MIRYAYAAPEARKTQYGAAFAVRKSHPFPRAAQAPLPGQRVSAAARRMRSVKETPWCCYCGQKYLLVWDDKEWN